MKESSVGARLIYATVMPCNELNYLGSSLEKLNTVEQCLVEV